MAKTYKNAIILPVRGSEDKPLFPNARGGVFDSDGHPIKDAFLRREYRQDTKLVDGKWDRSSGTALKHHHLIVPDKIGKTQNTLKGKYIFAGYLFPHYGHFMLESLANLWFIKKHPDTPIIWLGVHRQDTLNSVNKQFLELYDIRNPIHILTEQTEVEKLVVPQPGYLIHTRYQPEQVKALKLADAPDPQPGKKVWLSRSNVGKGVAFNEKTLEEILDRSGWTIYHPEEFTIKEQLEFLKDAEVVAGIEGSAFHTFVLIPDFKGKLHIFARRRRVEFDFIFIAETLGLDQEVHSVPGQAWSHGLPHWQANLFWLRITPILDILGVKRSDTAVALPSDNLGAVSKQLTSHFDIKLAAEFWASDSTVFADDTKGRRIIVSDRIEFNTHTLPKNVDHLDITPDQLLTSQILKRVPGLICIRHHENALDLIRAFNSTVAVATGGTIWLIEYYADERPVAKQNTLQHENRIPSGNAELVRYIGSCCPMISLARLRGTNIAIAWQHPKVMHFPELPSLAALSTTDTFERSPILPLNDIAVQIRESLPKKQ